MGKRYIIKLNSIEKVEELLQEIYEQACRQLNEIQSEINKLQMSTNLGDEDVTFEDKAKYGKIMHDFLGDKNIEIKKKFEIAKFMGEIIKHKGDIDGALNDPAFRKSTKLDLKSLREGISKTLTDNSGQETTNYNLGTSR